jgi:hypothetical protein
MRAARPLERLRISSASISRAAAARFPSSTIAPASIKERRSSSTKNGFPRPDSKLIASPGKFSIQELLNKRATFVAGQW